MLLPSILPKYLSVHDIVPGLIGFNLAEVSVFIELDNFGFRLGCEEKSETFGRVVDEITKHPWSYSIKNGAFHLTLG